MFEMIFPIILFGFIVYTFKIMSDIIEELEQERNLLRYELKQIKKELKFQKFLKEASNEELEQIKKGRL